MSLDKWLLKDIVEPLNSYKVKIMLIQLLVNTILQETTFINIYANKLLFYNRIVELMKILYIVNIFFSDKIVELCPKWWMIQDEDSSIDMTMLDGF